MPTCHKFIAVKDSTKTLTIFLPSVTGPEDTDREPYSQQKPIARKRIAVPNNAQHVDTQVGTGYSSQRKRMHFEEELPAGSSRLAGRLGSVVGRTSL